MRLASRGGWYSTSTEYPVIGGSNRLNKGACTGPLYFLSTGSPKSENYLDSLHLPQSENTIKKNERPVGVPAALAWGMEGMDLKLGSSPYRSGGVGRSTALASSRTTHRIKIPTIIPPAPGAELNSRSHPQACRTRGIASLVRGVHSHQYFAPGLLGRFSSTPLPACQRSDFWGSALNARSRGEALTQITRSFFQNPPAFTRLTPGLCF